MARCAAHLLPLCGTPRVRFRAQLSLLNTGTVVRRRRLINFGTWSVFVFVVAAAAVAAGPYVVAVPTLAFATADFLNYICCAQLIVSKLELVRPIVSVVYSRLFLHSNTTRSTQTESRKTKTTRTKKKKTTKNVVAAVYMMTITCCRAREQCEMGHRLLVPLPRHLLLLLLRNCYRCCHCCYHRHLILNIPNHTKLPNSVSSCCLWLCSVLLNCSNRIRQSNTADDQIVLPDMHTMSSVRIARA